MAHKVCAPVYAAMPRRVIPVSRPPSDDEEWIDAMPEPHSEPFNRSPLDLSEEDAHTILNTEFTNLEVKIPEMKRAASIMDSRQQAKKKTGLPYYRERVNGTLTVRPTEPVVLAN